MDGGRLHRLRHKRGQRKGTDATVKKKIAMALLCICLFVLSAGITTAYLTAEDTARNVITTGEVAVSLVERQLADGAIRPYPARPIAVMPGQTVSKIVSAANDAGQPGDRLILTKALGVGLICSANRVGEVTKEQMDGAVQSMTTLNKTAAEISRKYTVHACTDVTGFGFLGHLHEMMGRGLSCEIDVKHIPVLPGARESADAFLYTAAGQRNRNHVGAAVQFENVPFSMEEVLFDPQTSGGLLMAAAPDEAEKLEQELQNAGLPARIVGTITEPGEVEIFVRG